jgi:hypothetical protein
MRAAANSTQAGALHYHRITAARRAQVCRVLAQKPVQAFVMASHKSNMREYVNERIGAMLESGKFYNWCLRLLLERVTAWAELWFARERRPLAPIRIVFARRGHDYDHFFSYVDLLRMQAEAGTLFLRGPGLTPILLDRTHWAVESAESRAGLQLADTVASAFYQAANTASTTWDLEPAKSLREIIHSSQRGAANTGVTLWPLPHQAAVPQEARTIFREYGYEF